MGGGVMRTAAKVAGIGTVMHSGLRCSVPAVPSFSAKSLRTASVVPAAATLSAHRGADVAPIERPLLDSTAEDFVDWKVIGDEGELVMSAGEPMARVVFGGAPTFKEAQEATQELKEALDRAYLSSPKITEVEELSAADKVSGPSLLSNPGYETESVIIATTTVPQHAYQAFELLSRSAEAQNVVASIASDPNIWNAMMGNTAVKQFMESQKTANAALYECASDSEVFNPVSSEKLEDESDSRESFDLERLFNGFVDKVKMTVNTMVSNLSTYIQNIFEPPADDNGNSRTIASGFMGLAVMVVMVVLMKRV